MMKLVMLFWLFTTLLVAQLARGETNDLHIASSAMLAPELRPLYMDLQAGISETNIVGRNLDIILHLRMCTDKWLLFKDTRIVVDDNTSYYLVKWLYSLETIKPIIGKSDIQCRVTAKISEVVRGESTPYPYVIAKIENIEELK
jgi:hypothetical protein